ncbi:MAG: aldo/keto reductase [Acidiferrobacterales bacterium]|nr:aldo/keto reductase [Acidiferrobacterales bacterium]
MKNLNNLSRRDFLTYSSALGAAVTLPILPTTAFAQDSINTKAIPGTDEYLPLVGSGSPDFFYTTPDGGNNEAAMEVIKTMVEAGGRMIDTPAFFRPDPPIVGPIIQQMGLQSDLFLIGKITVDGAEAAQHHLDLTISNLGRKTIDVMMLHNLRDYQNTWPVLEKAKAAGRVRYIGVSEATDRISNEELEAFMLSHDIDFLMTSYSMFRPQIEERILPLAADQGVAVIAIEVFKTMDDGAYFNVTNGKELPDWSSKFDCDSWAQFALKYVLSHPAVTCSVIETSRPRNMLDNMGAAYGKLPDAATRKRMADHYRSLS